MLSQAHTDNSAQLYLAEPYFVHNQVAYAMNNAERVWVSGDFILRAVMTYPDHVVSLHVGECGDLGLGLFYIFDSRLVHMREINRLCYKWLN